MTGQAPKNDRAGNNGGLIVPLTPLPKNPPKAFLSHAVSAINTFYPQPIHRYFFSFPIQFVLL
jgi:hypothetical protein